MDAWRAVLSGLNVVQLVLLVVLTYERSIAHRNRRQPPERPRARRPRSRR